MSGIISIYDLLSTGPGAFVYHLMILLALLAAAGISFIEYRRTGNPDQQRFLQTFTTLLLLRVPLLIGGPFRPEASSNLLVLVLNTIIPLLVYALEVSSLTLLWWAFLSPMIGRRASKTFLISNLTLAGVAAIAFFPSWFRMVRAFPLAEYAALDWPQIFWDLWAVLLSLSGAVFLFYFRERLGYSMPAISFLLLTLGNSFILFDVVGLGRLINLLGYPLLIVTIYRAALQDLYAFRQELERLSKGALRQTHELMFLVEVSKLLGQSLELDSMLADAAESVCHSLDADRTAILLTDGNLTELQLATQFVPLQRPGKRAAPPPVKIAEQPLLEHTIRRRKQLVLGGQRNSRRLLPLYHLLESQEEGPIILQPLVREQNVLGVMVVGRDRNKKAFEEEEVRSCESVAPQIAAAIENAQLYQDLAHTLEIQEEETGRREAILESIAEGIIVTNSQGRAVLVNAAAEEILGVSRDRLLGRPFQRFLETAATDREVDVEHLMGLKTPLHALFELEHKQVQVSAATVWAKDGEALGIVAVLRDVTKEIQAEEAKREFIAVISHELRTPLTAILGYTEALHSGMVGDLTGAQQRFTRTVHENARRMITMANNLIALSEAERGHLKLEYRKIDIESLVKKTMEAFVPQLEAQEMEWALEIEEDIPLIDGDPDRIRQILVNLLSNAIKFTFPGGHVTVGGSTVRDDEQQEADYCRLWVRDTGIGIPADKQMIIWERFSRAEGPVKEEGSGLGLGLTIVKSLAEAHAGRVWVESTPGEGSTFTVLLPIRRPVNSLLETDENYPKLGTAASDDR